KYCFIFAFILLERSSPLETITNFILLPLFQRHILTLLYTFIRRHESVPHQFGKVTSHFSVRYTCLGMRFSYIWTAFSLHKILASSIIKEVERVKSMNQEIEIEFKTVIQENDFKALHKQLPFDDQPVKQINYYFETNQQDFKRKRCALRIREKAGKYTLTLKEPHKEGILETHDELTKEECTAWLQGQPVIKPNTNKQLAALGIQEKNIFYFGALKTERYTYQTTDLLYVLDKSEYNQQLDYELELEATDYTAGEQAFGELLKQYNIIKQEPVTKIERFFNTLQEGNNQAFEE